MILLSYYRNLLPCVNPLDRGARESADGKRISSLAMDGRAARDLAGDSPRGQGILDRTGSRPTFIKTKGRRT